MVDITQLKRVWFFAAVILLSHVTENCLSQATPVFHRGLNNTPVSFAVNEGGEYLAIDDYEGTVAIFDVKTGLEIRRQQYPPYYYPSKLKFIDGTNILAIGLYGGLMQSKFKTLVWNIESKQYVSLSGDMRLLSVLEQNKKLLLVETDRKFNQYLTMYNVSSGSLTRLTKICDLVFGSDASEQIKLEISSDNQYIRLNQCGATFCINVVSGSTTNMDKIPYHLTWEPLEEIHDNAHTETELRAFGWIFKRLPNGRVDLYRQGESKPVFSTTLSFRKTEKITFNGSIYSRYYDNSTAFHWDLMKGVPVLKRPTGEGRLPFSFWESSLTTTNNGTFTLELGEMGFIQIRDTMTNKVVRLIKPNITVQDAELEVAWFSPDHRYIVVQARVQALGGNHQTIVFDGSSLTELASVAGMLTDLHYRMDLMAYVDNEGKVHSFDLKQRLDKSLRKAGAFHANPERTIYSEDGSWLAVEFRDGRTVFYNVSGFKTAPIYTLLHHNSGDWVVYDPKGRFNCPPGTAETIHLTCGMKTFSILGYKDFYHVSNLVEKILSNAPLVDPAVVSGQICKIRETDSEKDD